MDVAALSVLPQKPIRTVQESLLNVNLGLIVLASLHFIGYLVHDRLIADSLLHRFRATHVEEVLESVSFDFFFL